jgi:uncharacterized protein with HEPN domain
MIRTETRFRLEDMLEFAHEAVEILGDRDVEQLSAERIRELALVRAVEVVGEAAARIPPEDRSQFNLPWGHAIGLRNILIHGYRKLRLDIVVATVRDDFPPMIGELESILEKDRHER